MIRAAISGCFIILGCISPLAAQSAGEGVLISPETYARPGLLHVAEPARVVPGASSFDRTDTLSRDQWRDEGRIVPPERYREFRPGRFWTGAGVFATADVAAMVALNELWYKDHDRGRFHFHDDWPNWVQQDKLGHLYVAYHLARVTGEYSRWSGLSDRRSALIGGGVSWLFQLQIELLDGFSEAWGFSLTDLAFNTVGSVVGGLQVANPEMNWFALKYSYRPSPFRDPSIGYLGNALKDYDGISYWFVIRPGRLSGVPEWWPEWFALSVGYSGDNLKNPLPTPSHPHYRQVFLGPDLDVLKAINWPQPWMRTVAGFFSFVRIPAPALEFGREMKWHWLYY